MCCLFDKPHKMKSQLSWKDVFKRASVKIGILIILGIFWYPLSLLCQPDNNDTGPVKTGDIEKEIPLLFEEDEILSISIATDLRKLTNDISDSAGYHEGILSYVIPAGDTITMEMEVKTRGNFRRRKTNCDFPPLYLKFPKKAIRNTIFEGQRKLKLVTHCQSDDPGYEQYLFQEYLVYRLYNLLTSFSYRVRLTDVTYVDIWDPENIIKTHAFILESDNGMAKRNGGNILETEEISFEDLNMYQYTLLCLFQYMIINNDWSTLIVKNIKLIKLNGSDVLIPVPFDFDFAGIVNTSYRLTEDPDITVFEDRVYYGVAEDPKLLENCTSHFISRRDAIYSLYNDFQLIDRKQRSTSRKILDDFFDLLDHPETWNYGFKNGAEGSE